MIGAHYGTNGLPNGVVTKWVKGRQMLFFSFLFFFPPPSFFLSLSPQNQVTHASAQQAFYCTHANKWDSYFVPLLYHTYPPQELPQPQELIVGVQHALNLFGRITAEGVGEGGRDNRGLISSGVRCSWSGRWYHNKPIRTLIPTHRHSMSWHLPGKWLSQTTALHPSPRCWQNYWAPTPNGVHSGSVSGRC